MGCPTSRFFCEKWEFRRAMQDVLKLPDEGVRGSIHLFESHRFLQWQIVR